MNAFGSECSSGCESGWTLYLEHSFHNQNASHGDTPFTFYEDKRAKNENSEEEDEEEDLSMVSDASSGPPHPPDDDAYLNEEGNNGCFYSAPPKAVKLAKSAATKKQKVKENKHSSEDQHLPSFLHDTASSPFFDFSTNKVSGTNQQTYTGSVLDYSQGFSATYFEQGRPSFQEEHFGFLQPSLSENELQSNNRWYGGKGMGMR